MAYGTNKKTRSTIQRVVTSVDKSTGKKTVKKYPAKEMKSKSITEKEFNSNGKTKATPAPKKASPSKKKDSSTLDMISKAPGYVVTYPLKKTLDIGIAAGNKLKQMKSDYETGKRMREKQEFKAKGGKSIRQKISESVKTYNKMQSSKKTK